MVGTKTIVALRQFADSRLLYVLLCLLALVHTLLLAIGAIRNGPTFNEPSHLVSGMCYWTAGRCDAYAVNPPLVRSIAALPILLAHGELQDDNGDCICGYGGFRPESPMGEAFVRANRDRVLWFHTIARLTLLPLSLLGGYVCFRWARDAYGDRAGLLAASLWYLSPNIIAHAQLITPDAHAASLGVVASYLFWKWLENPGWTRASAAGTGLGFAISAKTTLVVLLLAWTLAWCVVRLLRRTNRQRPRHEILRQMGMLLCIVGIGLYIVNSLYGFAGTFTRLGEYEFESQLLSGTMEPGLNNKDNRFRNSWIGCAPVPLPRAYVEGIDTQYCDFESSGATEYLGGEFSEDGWWYYYLYAMGVKLR
jgi:hypothetical protein